MLLGDKLVSLRKENKLTQAKVAEILNVSRQAISRWESGAAIPSTDNLKGLSELYKVPVDYLLKKDDSESQLEEAQVEERRPASNGLRTIVSKKIIVLLLAVAVAAATFVAVLCDPGHHAEDETTPIEKLDESKWDDTGTGEFTFDTLD